MSPRRPAPGDLERAFAQAYEIKAQIERKERSIRRRTQVLAYGLAALLGPGGHTHRWRVGIHAFDVDGTTCLAAAYLEKRGDDYEYRYAVLCGGEAAVRILRTADLDPGDSDEPGHRRVGLASYQDCDDFLYRLPMYLKDAVRSLEARRASAAGNDQRIRAGRRALRGGLRAVRRDGGVSSTGYDVSVVLPLSTLLGLGQRV